MSQNTPETIVIRAEPIELSQLLKFAGVVGTGGEAKFAINSGEVTVNGAVELQARKKILGGHTVEVAGRTLLVKLGAPAAVKVKAVVKPQGKPAAKGDGKSVAKAGVKAGGKPADLKAQEKADAKAPAKSFVPPVAKQTPAAGGAQAWAGESKGRRAAGQPGKPAAGVTFAKPVSDAGKPARATKPVSRDRDDEGYEDESPREKPAAGAASQRTFFYTELLKAQQAKRRKKS